MFFGEVFPIPQLYSKNEVIHLVNRERNRQIIIRVTYNEKEIIDQN